MTVSFTDWATLTPALVVILTALATVAVDLVLPPKAGRWPLALTSGGGLVAALVMTVQRLVWSPPPLRGFGGSLVLDDVTGFVSLTVLAAAGLLLIASPIDVRRRQVAFGEYYGLVLLATAGMMLLAGSNDFLMIFLNLEVVSLALYVLTGITRRNPRANEAAVKYFVTGAFATGFLLLGVAMLYGATGTIRLDAIGASLAAGNVSPLLAVGLGLVLVGFSFKVGAVPFHMWVPDVYEGAPTTSTAFMAVTVKASAFGALLRVLLVAAPTRSDLWADLLWWIAVATMILGNLLAAQQTSVKRMLAFSSVAHTGYVMVALASMRGTDGTFSTAPASAALFYLFVYAFMTLGAFLFLVYLGHEVPIPGKEPEWQDAEQLDDLAGLAYRRPWAALAMTLFLVSLAGFPPTAGFIGKFYLFGAAVEQGHVVLAVIGVLASLVSLYYYLRVVVYMFMRETVIADEKPAFSVGAVVLGAALATALVGLMPARFWDFATSGVEQITTAQVARAER